MGPAGAFTAASRLPAMVAIKARRLIAGATTRRWVGSPQSGLSASTSDSVSRTAARVTAPGVAPPLHTR